MENEFVQMIKQAKMGDKEVLINLIMSQKQDYYHLANIYMKNQEDALDAMEDMILKVYENIQKLNDETAFYSCTKTILVNCCKNNLRRKKRVILIRNIPEGLHDDVYQVKDDQLDIEKHDIQRMTYSKNYHEMLEIPLN